MTPEPTNEDRDSQRADELSRFESEGGATEHVIERRNARARGLQPRGSDHRGRILIVRATRERHTCAIVDGLTRRLRSHGFAVEIGDASTGVMPPPQDYDVVILGVPTMSGTERTLIATYIEEHRAGLSEVPTGIFTVSKSGTGGFVGQFVPSDGVALETYWTDVQRFADAIAIELAHAAVTAERTAPHLGGVP